MSTFRPTGDAGRICLLALVALAAVAALFAFVLGIEALGGCQLNEAGSGSCRLAGIELVAPLSVLAGLAAIGFFLGGPFLALGALAAGLICIVRREW